MRVLEHVASLLAGATILMLVLEYPDVLPKAAQLAVSTLTGAVRVAFPGG